MDSHLFSEANKGDSRSPCPALNALANQGYLPRDGKNIHFLQLVHAVHNVYNWTYPLAVLLALSGFAACGHATHLDLEDLSAHNKIEHDASLVHADALPGSRHAPVCVDKSLLDSLLRHYSVHGGMTLEDFAAARVEREAHLLQPLDVLHVQISQGEAALAWILMKNEEGVVPISNLKEWLGEERLPEGWKKPKCEVGLLQARRYAAIAAREMDRLRKSQKIGGPHSWV